MARTNVCDLGIIEVESVNDIVDNKTGKKNDDKKMRWHLVPGKSMREVVRVFDYGADKYGENNWMKLKNAKVRYYDAAMRHIDAFSVDGETKDPESGLHPLAHAIASLMFILEFELSDFLGEDDAVPRK